MNRKDYHTEISVQLGTTDDTQTTKQPALRAPVIDFRSTVGRETFNEFGNTNRSDS